ncbi:hypothetical protein Tph_c28230 [Thermacetogenium phaeum DSM 12270]|uniref:Uncharacterized protein n=1 Tax=Thermacetogenium phaeum (strain ATCC BAA-254 / DSM 26808 / PB) TaxID=1089553 RepID=K4LJC6_THEPS|nr:nucleoside triphosphate pyrophosphohydrolase [Thermacetogenium phaeum]AFV12988.1 hypothetical protein Tph_c28230 [Thermacetogenium phaeum DSM 12270]
MKKRGTIYVVGLGPGDPLDLPPLNLSLLRSYRVYLRTERHPVVAALREEGISFHPLDGFYERSDTFEEVYRGMAEFLLQTACEQGEPLVFAVPGNPLVGESVVDSLRTSAPERGVQLKIFTAPGFLDALFPLLGIDPGEGLLIADSFQLCPSGDGSSPLAVTGDTGIVIMQVYNRHLASEVKLTLMDSFPDDHRVMVVESAGVRGKERVSAVPLYELDRREPDHLTTVYVPPLKEGETVPRRTLLGRSAERASACSLEPLVGVMERLLSPEGCPWDRQQTHQSLKKYLIEEAYEVVDAIDEGDMHKLCEELGDLLLQIVFHTALAEREREFTIAQVIGGITEKLIRRHPHVFGGIKVNGASEVLRNWEAIKQKEKEGERKSLLAGVPRHLPALQRAQKVQAKAALVGFDWPDAEGAAAKVEEEWQEVKAAWSQGEREALRQEFGDFLFAVVNTCRLLRIDAEEALRAAVEKFMKRFWAMELKAQEEGIRLDELALSELDELWNEVKEREKQK